MEKKNPLVKKILYQDLRNTAEVSWCWLPRGAQPKSTPMEAGDPGYLSASKGH